MCGIVGYLDKRGGHGHPVGRVLLSMQQALSCRGPDSAGLAVFGPPRPSYVLQVKLREDQPPQTASNGVLDVLRDTQTAVVLRHQITGAYLRVEVEGSADPVILERTILERIPQTEVVSLGHQLEIVKQVGSPAQ